MWFKFSLLFIAPISLFFILSSPQRTPASELTYPSQGSTSLPGFNPIISVTPQPTGGQILLPYNSNPLPDLDARSYIVQDYPTDVVLTQKNAYQPLPPASTTKIMTALIALQNYQINETITIPTISVPGAKVNLVAGDQLTVENLLYALLLASGNDAAVVLAEHFPGTQPAFVQAMNHQASILGLEQTNFVNPTGLHSPLHLSSASDLVKLAKYALTNPIFAQIVSTTDKEISSQDNQYRHTLVNLNQLLGTVPGVKGIKTGWTEEAGEALITYIDRDQHSLLIAVLGSDNRFEDTKKLIDWAYQYTTWK